MSYTADSIRDSIRIRIVTPDSIRIRFERKLPIRSSLVKCQQNDAEQRRLQGIFKARVRADRICEYDDIHKTGSTFTYRNAIRGPNHGYR